MAESLKPTLRPLLRRLAVASGAAVALLALCGHAPIWVCCARGGVSFLGLLLVGELGLEALQRSQDAEQVGPVTEPTRESEQR